MYTEGLEACVRLRFMYLVMIYYVVGSYSCEVGVEWSAGDLLTYEPLLFVILHLGPDRIYERYSCDGLYQYPLVLCQIQVL